MKKMNKMVIESLLVATIICGSICSVYANDVDDYEYTGPGITLEVASYDGSSNRIYSWGIGPTVESTYDTTSTPGFINDGGPGMDITIDDSETAKYYDDGGPGMELIALSLTENAYVDNGPMAVDSTANPENYLAMLENLVPSNGEGVYRDYKKNTKASTK